MATAPNPVNPVTPSAINQCVPAPADTMCGRFVNVLLQLPAQLAQFWTWAFNSGGTATSAFQQNVNYLQPGDVFWSANPEVPTPQPGGRLPCNGGSYSSTQYPALYDAIGQTYAPYIDATPSNPTGTGTQIAPASDGQGGFMFYVPNAQGRSLIATGTSTDTNGNTITATLGQLGGEAGHILTTQEMPPHQHSYEYQASPGSSPYGAAGSDIGNQTVQTGSTGGNSNSPPTANPHNNLHPVIGFYLYIQS